MLKYKLLEKKINDGEFLILDGGVGTELEKRGVGMDSKAWCGLGAINNFKILKDIHLDYINSGARIITANTFASNRLSLKGAGFADMFYKVNSKAIEAAKSAIIESKEDVFLAGSLSHFVPDFNDETKAPKDQETQEVFDEMADLLRDQQCDFILLEMMYHPVRTQIAFDAASKAGLPIWAGFSARRGKNGEILNYYAHEDIPLEDHLRILEKNDVQAAGIMHTSSDIIEESVNILKEIFNGPIFVYPDSGYFSYPNWIFEKVISPDKFKDFSILWKSQGVQVIGGCCGLSPKHIKKLSNI